MEKIKAITHTYEMNDRGGRRGNRGDVIRGRIVRGRFILFRGRFVLHSGRFDRGRFIRGRFVRGRFIRLPISTGAAYFTLAPGGTLPRYATASACCIIYTTGFTYLYTII